MIKRWRLLAIGQKKYTSQDWETLSDDEYMKCDLKRMDESKLTRLHTIRSGVFLGKDLYTLLRSHTNTNNGSQCRSRVLYD